MAYATVVGIEIVYAIATLVLVSLGLAIVFGMMRVINLAHGEFLVMGGYSATVAFHHGINFWVAILLVPPIVVGFIGFVIERTIIRVLYGRIWETMLACWGLSLFLVGLMTTIFGGDTEGVSDEDHACAVEDAVMSVSIVWCPYPLVFVTALVQGVRLLRLCYNKTLTSNA